MEVKLQDAIVILKDKITWGDAQKVKSALATGEYDFVRGTGGKVTAQSVLESNYVAMECIIVEIREGEKTKKFTREWVDDLSMDDGDKLFAAVQEVSKKK